MSSRPRVRRNRGQMKFLENEDNQNVIGVMEDSTIEARNKIQEKQEDMFDAHKIKKNVLEEESITKTNAHSYLDLESEQPSTMTMNEEQASKKQEQNVAKNKRKRGRRQVVKKKFDSGDENNQEEEEKIQSKVEEKQQNVFTDQLDDQQFDLQPPKEEKKESRSNEEQEEQEEQEKRQAEKMKQMVNKKTPAPVSNYIHMHAIMNKAGFNKEERKKAIYTPLEPNQQTFVYFKRYQSGFSQCYQIIGEDQRPIMFCENQRGCIGCNYYISLTKQMDKNNPAYLGKLRGNAAGSIYQLFDQGIQPDNQFDRSKFRVSMGFIEYESNFLGMKGPRKLKAVVPKVDCLEDFDMFKFSEEQNLSDFVGSNVYRLRNKSPRWNQRLKSYALNFGGRVKQASIKNFILIDDRFDLEDEEKAPNVIVFGKIDDSTFALEFSHPLSLFQAFGIAMSEFDFKLKCE